MVAVYYFYPSTLSVLDGKGSPEGENKVMGVV